MNLKFRTLRTFKPNVGHVLICLCFLLVLSATIVIFVKANQNTGNPKQEAVDTDNGMSDTTVFEESILDAESEVVSEETTVEETMPEEPPYNEWEEVPLDSELQMYIEQEARNYKINPEVIFAMCWRESKYNPLEIGDNGQSYGMMQVQPRWHYKTMLDLGCTNLLDPYQNVRVGIEVLANLIEQYDGNVNMALVAYNGGRYKGTITQYAKDVMAEAQRIHTYNIDKY